MFSKATVNFVNQVDPDGNLIHVSRVNDSHKLLPMALVVKRKRVWFWQRPRYQPTDFTLADLLLGDEVLKPGVRQTDFATYTGSYGTQISGSLDAGTARLTLEGSGTSHLQTCFGQLKREELDVSKLVEDSRNRSVDMEHMLMQQLEKRAEVLAVVKERIFTTSSCSIKQTKKDHCFLQGLLGFLGLLTSSFNVCVKDKGNIDADSDVSLEIPPGTAVAYSVLNLDIKKDGRYALCLRAEMSGGFEADSMSWFSNTNLDALDGAIWELPLSQLLNRSEEMDFSPLGELPEPTRGVFAEMLRETLTDRPALSSLQFFLEEMCNDETPTNENGEPSDGQREPLEAILNQPGPDRHSGNGHCGATALLSAAHLLVSAMEELPDETLRLLSTSSREDLSAFDTLMCKLKESSEPLPVHALPDLLQDDRRFQLAERLFGSAKVALRRDGASLCTEMESNAGLLPLLLCLSVHGLAALSSGWE